MSNLSESNKQDIIDYISSIGLGQERSVVLVEKDTTEEIYSKNLEEFSGILEFEVLGFTEFSERVALLKYAVFVNKALGNNEFKLVELFNDGTDVSGLSLAVDNTTDILKVNVTSAGVNYKYELIVRTRVISE